MRRSIWRCKTTMLILSKTTPAIAKTTVSKAAESDAETSQPAKLISVHDTVLMDVGEELTLPFGGCGVRHGVRLAGFDSIHGSSFGVTSLRRVG